MKSLNFRKAPKKIKRNILLCLLGLTLGLAFASLIFIRSSDKTVKPEMTATASVQRTIPADETILPSDASAQPAVESGTVKSSVQNIPILMYHYIRVVEDPKDTLGINLSVTPDKFAKQLDYLQSKGYHAINFKDVVANKIPTKPVILTFDDGYEDFYSTAYPELQKHNMTAVSFIITGKSDSHYMTKEQIKTLSINGIEFGSHTISHPDLSTLDDSRANNEIRTSKTDLEKIIGQNVISFCYPSGKYNDKTLDLVKNAGYLFATTTKSGIGDLKSPLTLNRYRMNADTEISAYLK